MGAANAHYLGIKVFSETDFTDDLKAIDVPTLVMHGDDDQIGPLLSVKLSWGRRRGCSATGDWLSAAISSVAGAGELIESSSQGAAGFAAPAASV